MSQDNELLQEAVSSMYALFQEENIRDQCIAREEYYFKENQRIEALKKVEELTANTINQENVIANQNTVIIDQKSTIADQKNMIAQKDADLQAALQRIAELEEQLRN